VHGDHVTMEKGSGLVHIAPAHGHDDYVLGLRHNLKMVFTNSMSLTINSDGCKNLYLWDRIATWTTRVTLILH